MEGTYGVCLDGQKVGSATVRRLGLYYEVTCRCNLKGGQMLHLVIRGTNFSEDLGLLVPQGGMLELKKRVPAKRMVENAPEFFLRRRNTQPDEFIPITPEGEFPFLRRLNDCVFAVRDGRKGVILLPQK